MARRPPVTLSEAVVDARDLMREFLVLTAIAAVCVWVAFDAPSAFSVAIAAVAVVFVSAGGLAAAPGSLRLTVSDDGLTLRAFFVFVRRIPWSAVGSIEVAEGWQGETVAVEVNGAAGEGTILGLPVDPGLGSRAFVTGFGLTPIQLRDLLRERRDGAGA
jgi:hypothetical protein